MPKIPKKLDEKLSEKARLLDRTLNKSIVDSQKLLKTAIRELEKNIISTMSDLKSGRRRGILGTAANLRASQAIHGELVEYFEDYYGKGARRAVKGYNKVAADIKRYWTGAKAFRYTPLDRDMMQVLAAQSLDEFIQFGDLARERVAKAMYTHVISGLPFGNLVKEMEAVLGTSVDARGGNMARYADLWANDGIMNFEQAVTLKKATDMGIRYFLYQGGVVPTSRPFCVARAGGIYTRREIAGWSKMSWKGKRGPALIYRGGWNCRHHWIPIETSQFEE